MYHDKIITVDEALKLVKSGDIIVTGLAASEARSFLTQLHTIADQIENVTVTNCLPMADAEYFIGGAYSDKFEVAGWFYTGPLRRAQKFGNVSYIPNHLHLAGKKRFMHQTPTIYVGNATYPDKHGYMSLSLSNVYEKTAIKHADIVILEMNNNLPRTFGDLEIHVDDVTALIETDYEIPTLPDIKPNELDLKIGANIASYINDGDCIQLGIGGIPNAVAASLHNKKDLGIHTEMFTTGMMNLIKAGAVSNKRKNFHPGKSICAFALGSKELYDFLDDNPSIQIMDGNYVNDPCVIGKNDNQVSINTTIEVDLTGQCASESIGTTQYSGSGGQADTAIGAQRAKNGRSFIALYSTASVKDKETGVRKTISKIVPTLKPGAGVTLSRNDVDYVVTEYGVASLRGTTIKERVHRLIEIAHPDFRDELYEEARKYKYIL
jgi:acyl-CoA hydrolase